jgi:transglutaminase-like putative cysteine protease
MALAGVVAFGAGVGWTEGAPLLAGSLLLLTLFWRTSPTVSARLEHLWLPLALLLMARAVYHVAMIGGDVVIPVVDLLLLLMCAEALRSLDTFNDVRLYGLSFALLLAATAYRPGIVFAAAFVVYVALASPALTVGYFRRSLRRHGVPDVPIGRPLLSSAWALSGVTLLASVLVFLVFPRASQGWAGRGDVPSLSMAGFSDVVSIGGWGSSIQPNPAVVLRVEFPDGRPQDYRGLHWRGRSYDRFDGVRWTRSRRIRPSGGPLSWYRERWPGSPVAQRIYAEPLDIRVLFGLHPMVELEAEPPIHPLMDNVGDFGYWGSGAPTYTAYSMLGRPSAEDLRASDGAYMPDESYLQLPRLPQRIRALADSLTEGLETRYEKVERIERWLQTEFGYTLDLPRTAGEATLDHFLFERRQGHCEYFSTAMVVLLRAAGIEARNVNGFLGGSWSEVGDYLVVTQNEAHSWVEVWFPSHGWVTFDPTPSGVGSGGAQGTWFWPGRLLLDAIEHRWGKWVLDYSLQTQWDAIGRALAAVRDDAGGADRDTGGGGLLPWLIGAALLAAGTLVFAVRGARGGGQETRVYLRLVESCRRAGLVSGQVAPLELVERLRRAGGGAATPAARLVHLYLRARFAGEALADEERAEMARALRLARRALPASARTEAAPG